MTDRKFKTADDLVRAGVADPKWFVTMQIAAELKGYSVKEIARYIANGVTIDVEAWLEEQYEMLEDEAEEIIEDEIRKWNK